jgi:tetratricopeptide (TPR) repeat protein
MDQLVVLQEIYDSFSKGGGGLHSVDPNSIEGNCSVQVARLLEGSKQGKIDADLCLGLADCLQDVYEVKRLGDICKKAGLLELAIRCYDKAISLTRDKGLRAVLLNNLGQVYTYYGDLGRAVTYYRRSLKAFECAGDTSGSAHVQGNLGSAYRRAREWDKAIAYCHKSLKAFEGLGDELGSAQMVGSLGRIYAEMGEIDLATRYYGKSLKEFQKLGDRRSEAWILNWLGKISAKGKNWDQSIEYYNKSRFIFEDLGDEQSIGVILSNMGRVYLDSGDATKSRDCLERSLKLLHKETQPAYQNAAAWMAASYSVLAKEYQMEAKPSSYTKILKGDKKEERHKLAVQYHSRAADQYRDLAAMAKTDIPELRTTAGIARFISALSELQAARRDEEATALAQEAIFALKAAAASTGGAEKEKIEAIERSLVGMNEIWSSGQISNEPWKLSSAVAESIEHLLGGVCLAGEVAVFIYDALRGLGDAIEEERRSSDPSEQLGSAASCLRKAEKWFEAKGSDLGHESAVQIGNAAAILEKLLNVGAISAENDPSYIKGLLNYQPYKNALLLIGWVLVRNVLPAIDKTSYIYSWDESMNLMNKRPAGQPEAAEKTQDASDTGGEIEEEQILSNEPIVEAIATNGSSLMPAMAQAIQSPGFSKVALWPEKEKETSYKVNRFGPRAEAMAFEIAESKVIEAVEPKAQAARMDKNQAEQPTGFVNSPDVRSSTASTKGPKEMQYSFGIGAITRSNVIKALKALAIVVLALLAIDVILYLI